jgi:hypothetical protein
MAQSTVHYMAACDEKDVKAAESLIQLLNSDSMYFKVHSFRTRSVSERADWIQKIEIEKWYQQT